VPQDADLEAWQTLLVNTEIMVQEGDRACATVAGLLLFGSAPNRFLPQAGIDAVAYPGREKDYAAKERVALRAPIVSLFQVGCRAARNQLLKDVMRDYNYLEHTGMGVPRKIIKGMLDHNGTQPDLFEEEERFIVRLWK
jgi:predicted HTH transcriptional regulator